MDVFTLHADVTPFILYRFGYLVIEIEGEGAVDHGSDSAGTDSNPRSERPRRPLIASGEKSARSVIASKSLI